MFRPDGVIVSPFRNSSGYLYASTSRDNGVSWSVPRITNFPDATSPRHAGTLPDGTTFLINNPGNGNASSPRNLLTIALSPDGETFERAWLIRGEPTTMRRAG
ncbi:MAG: exo-alpha-sialidase [Verrucomicrobiales bacterium]